MGIRLEKVTEAGEPHLIRYCAEHGPEHDASFLPGRDFALSPETPAFLLWKDGTVVGAVILMRTGPYVSAGKGRFSIFHSVLGTGEAYAELLGAIRPHFRDLRSVYLFIPEHKQDTAAILAQLGFHIERYSFVLEKRSPSAAEVRFPDEYRVQPLDRSDQVGLSGFAGCLNEAFQNLAGHVDSSADDIRAWFDDEGYVEGGICLLTRDGEPAGTVCVMRNSENREAGEVGALGIAGRCRGMGIGRSILRYACSFAAGKGLDPVILSVNAENEAALSLYRSEGFVLTHTMVCYARANDQDESSR
jgi:mycothiol synthase